MWQKAFAMAAAMALMLVCAARVSAQEIVNLPAGLHRLDARELEGALGVGRIEALAVTLPPARELGVVFYDGAPLARGRAVGRGEIGRIWVFSSAQNGTVPVGVTVFPEPPADRTLKIRCINRKVSPKLEVYHPIKEETIYDG